MAASDEVAWAQTLSERKTTITTTAAATATALSTAGGAAQTTQEARTLEIDAAATRQRQTATKQLHVAALEEVVSVNSFFTAAVFIGISFNASQQTSLVSTCQAGADVPKNLVVHEVIAFSCYLFSTLVAQGLKLKMTLSSLDNQTAQHHHLLSPRLLRLGMILSALGSIVGTIFLMLSMVSVIQIRLGLISCHSPWSKRAVIPLLTLVSSGLLSFICPVLYAVITYK